MRNALRRLGLDRRTEADAILRASRRVEPHARPEELGLQTFAAIAASGARRERASRSPAGRTRRSTSSSGSWAGATTAIHDLESVVLPV